MFCNPSASNSGMIVTCDGVVLGTYDYELGGLRCVMRDEGQFWCVPLSLSIIYFIYTVLDSKNKRFTRLGHGIDFSARRGRFLCL